MPNSDTVTAEASLDPDCRREVTPARVTAPGQATSVSSGAAVGGSGLVRVGARTHYAVVAMVALVGIPTVTSLDVPRWTMIAMVLALMLGGAFVLLRAFLAGGRG